MVRPREIEYEFEGLKEGESFIYWNHYSKALEEYTEQLEKEVNNVHSQNKYLIAKNMYLTYGLSEIINNNDSSVSERMECIKKLFAL